MEELKVKFLMGPAECNDKYIPEYSRQFLSELEKVLGMKVSCAEIEEVKTQPLPVYFIASGGAEQGFKELHTQTKEPYILLTTPAYNSLAAAMEIMGYLQENGKRGEILHGSMDKIAERLKVLVRVADAKEKLNHMRLGCFGTPGGLIASDADPDVLRVSSGMELIVYELEELVEEYQKGGYPENQYTEELKKKNYDPQEIEKALNVYGALKRLIEKHDLHAVSVKCFDLLELIHTTGCLALAILNAEGIPAACEGDQKSLVSMAIMKVLTGKSGFMANPSCMDPDNNEIIFAHCTLPIDMPDSYFLTTHFESGIGVAVACDIEPQQMTIFKCDDTLTRYYAGRAQLVETMHRKDLCRSQMKLRLEDGTEYFAKRPVSNHHIICKGDWKEIIDEYFKEAGQVTAV
ncbi:MAG TPA: hypothetical protein H9756_08295 [Candidatus Mediterraneibacter gallistercoris]|uniref:L-arabinose isomerase central domain-containing protein n=1 Tax=Candidatus Mediterraneibacter gallistercoris TaxID=2838671 RepID=A0A9D2P5D5_9FIRM|nr:hypothetical protein [Candidatus Mediterraneibacter gallistercoris]